MRTLAKKTRNHLAKKLRVLRHRYFDNFIFVHINKTGGSSIQKALGIPFEHKTALEKIEEVGRGQWERKFTFTVIRNPWDKVVSHYSYRVQTNQTDMGAGSVGFKDWVRLAYVDKDPFCYDKPKMFMPQSDWIMNRDGQVLADRVCRFENLNEDFSCICKRLGRAASLPHIKPSDRGDYMGCYDKQTMAIVGSWFEKDIETFGYHF